jgi:hypothetical protein
MPMYINNIVITIAIIILCLLWISKKSTLFYSFLLSLIFFIPAFSIGNTRISGSYIWVALLLFVFLLNTIKTHKVMFPSGALFYIFTFAIILSISLFSEIIVNILNSEGIYSLVGNIKNVTGFAAFTLVFCLLNTEELIKVLYYGMLIAGVLNLIAVLSQLFFPNSFMFFYKLYWLPSNTPLESTMQIGGFVRAFGTFSSSVLLGAVSLLVFSMGLGLFVWRKDRKWLLIDVLWLIIGLFSLSKTFLAGFSIIFLVSLSISLVHRRDFLRKNLTVLAFILIIFVGGYFLLELKGFYASYYYEFIRHPFASLLSRYSVGSTNILLYDTYRTILSYPLFGVGMQTKFGEFLGDSSYVVLLHNSGIVGFSIAILFILYLFYSVLKSRSVDRLLVLIALLGSSLALPIIFFSVYQVPFLVYVLFLNPRQESES